MNYKQAIQNFPVIQLNYTSGLSNYVKFLQAVLCSYSMQMREHIGNTGGIDGSYGATTEAMVKLFQLDRGLTRDGIVGSNTWLHLANVTYPSTTYTASKGVWYYSTDSYSFSIKTGTSTSSEDVSSSSIWFYYNTFSTASKDEDKLISLGSLVK